MPRVFSFETLVICIKIISTKTFNSSRSFPENFDNTPHDASLKDGHCSLLAAMRIRQDEAITMTSGWSQVVPAEQILMGRVLDPILCDLINIGIHC